VLDVLLFVRTIGSGYHNHLKQPSRFSLKKFKNDFDNLSGFQIFGKKKILPVFSPVGSHKN
jgi:hypothetical protein